jgi:hypothetical protein
LIGAYSDQFYYDFFEWGTTSMRVARKKSRKVMKLNKTDPKGFATKVRGIVARPFMERAFGSHVQEVYDAIVAGYKKSIEKLGV